MNENLANNIAFSLAKGLQGSSALELLRRIGSTDAYASMPARQLAMLAGVESRIFDDAYRVSLLAQAGSEATFVLQNSITPYFITDPTYPHRVKDIPDAPIMLYKLGQCDLESPRMIGIVGTRHATPYGIDLTKKIVAGLAEKVDGLVVVSGLAFGIDAAAHNASLTEGVPTVAVMAHGLNKIYPAEHRALASKIVNTGGAIVTEYTTSAELHRGNFLARNRIIAALCDCVLVVESDYRGGAMSTARTAMHYNREVFAVPGRVSDIYSRGTNKLIADNIAQLVTCADDIISAMNWPTRAPQAAPAPKLFKPLTPQQQLILQTIQSNPDYTANDLCVRLGISYSALSNELFHLEMEDLIIAIPGGRFAVTIPS